MQEKIKCVVWDLDNTIWDGVLLEGDAVTIRPGVIDFIGELDRRGIIQSVASRSDHDVAMHKLTEFGLTEYFLAPQIGWSSKSDSIFKIATMLNINEKAIAFVDDDPFERDEVARSVAGVRVFDSRNLSSLSNEEAFVPATITWDGAQRRLLYMSDLARRAAEEGSTETSEEFLRTLGMVLTIAHAVEEDLDRAEELTVRTHQLNTTGKSYSREDLNRLINSPEYVVLIAGLEDCYGTYGRIALVVMRVQPGVWTIELFLTSCRVMSRGIGGVLLNWLAKEAQCAGVRLQGEFVANDRNRIMWITYRLANFRECGATSELTLLENDLTVVNQCPGYIDLRAQPISKPPYAGILAASTRIVPLRSK